MSSFDNNKNNNNDREQHRYSKSSYRTSYTDVEFTVLGSVLCIPIEQLKCGDPDLCL